MKVNENLEANKKRNRLYCLKTSMSTAANSISNFIVPILVPAPCSSRKGQYSIVVRESQRIGFECPLCQRSSFGDLWSYLPQRIEEDSGA